VGFGKKNLNRSSGLGSCSLFWEETSGTWGLRVEIVEKKVFGSVLWERWTEGKKYRGHLGFWGARSSGQEEDFA